MALPIVEAVPRERRLLRLRVALRDRADDVRVPGRAARGVDRRVQEVALEAYRLLGCRGFARVDLMLEEDGGELTVLEANIVPGLTETSLLPQAADAAGIDFDELGGCWHGSRCRLAESPARRR